MPCEPPVMMATLRSCSLMTSPGLAGCTDYPSLGGRCRPQDVAALAVHIMTNTALTGATYDIDGGQQLVQGG